VKSKEPRGSGLARQFVGRGGVLQPKERTAEGVPAPMLSG